MFTPGRRDPRVLRDRQEKQRDPADQGDDDREHRGEDRAVDEESRDHEDRFNPWVFRLRTWAAGFGSALAACGAASACPASDGIGLRVRLDFHLRPHLLDRAHDDPIVRLDFPLHHAEAVFLQGPRLDAAGLDLILRVDDVNVLESLVGLDGPIDDQQGLVRLADRQPHADEHAG